MERINWIHAPAKYLFAGKAFTVSLCLIDNGLELPVVEVCYTTPAGSDKLRMLPVDGYIGQESYSLYQATVSADMMTEGEITYYFTASGAKSDSYTVKVQSAPEIPPLTVTEISPWGGPAGKFIEFQNLTDHEIDLFDFDLLRLDNSGAFFRNHLADERGVNLIPAGGVAALRFVDVDFLKNGCVATKEAALAFFKEKFPVLCSDIDEREILLYHATTAKIEETGKPKLIGECFDLYGKYTARHQYLAPRDGGVEDAFFDMAISQTPESRDIRRNHSQLWCFDANDCKTGHILQNFAHLSPGFLDGTQSSFDINDVCPPAILPLSPTARVYLSDGDLAIRFALLGSASIGRAFVFVREGEAFVRHTAKINENGIFEVIVPFEKLAYYTEKLEYYIEATGGLYTAQYGTLEHPVVVCLTDNRGPEITKIFPADLQVLENDFRPKITVGYHDISGVNTRVCALCLDGFNVSADAKWTESGVVYTPAKKLALGKHTIEITLRDKLGNRSYQKVDFEIGDGKELNLYCGQVHSHTAESDGLGTPEQAIEHARDVNHMDYFAVTDHTHYMEEKDYRRQIRLANSVNVPGKFAMMYGFEMTWNSGNGFWGHTNVLNTEWINLYPMCTDMYEFYKQVEADEGAVAMFNHPDQEWGNNNEFEWCGKKIAERYCLSEINGAHYDPFYALSLSKGWRTAPVYNEDNHRTTWGDTGRMGYVLAPSLTRENILDGMRRRRTYSTTDRTMKVRYKVNGEWLGSVLQAPEKLVVDVEVTTERVEGIGKLELMTEDNIVVASVDAGVLREFAWQVEVTPDFDYYYIRITNGNTYTVTAPVFIEGRDMLNIKRVSYGVSEDAEKPHVVTVTLKNESDKPITDVTVDLYLTDYSGFVLRQLSPFESVHLGKLAAGESHTVSRRLPDVVGKHRVSAVAYGMAGKERYADTAYAMITPLVITKLLPLTSDLEKGGVTYKNPFPYVEIYNQTAMPMTLDGYSLRLWDSIGQHEPDEAHVFDLAGLKLAPHSTLTVWMKQKDADLTAEDFNARYGTKLLLGDDLAVTEKAILSTIPLARRLDIWSEKEILTRAPYGYFCSHDKDVEVDTPVLYFSKPHMTVEEKKLAVEGEILAPGKLHAKQQPKAMNGLRRRSENEEAERAAMKEKVITRLTKASLVPFRAAALVANAVSAFKGFFDTKE